MYTGHYNILSMHMYICTSNVHCVHIAAGRRIQAGATPLTNDVISETLRQFDLLSDISQDSIATHVRVLLQIFS